MSTIQRIPADAGETKTIIPAALSHGKAPPSFVLKTVTRRQREAMQYAMAEEGLTQFSDEAVRETVIEELCRLWKCEPHAEMIERVRSYWQGLDDYVDQLKANGLEREQAKEAGEEGPPPLAEFSHPEEAHFDELMERLDANSPLIRKMRVANVRFQRELGRFAIAHAVIDWTGLSTPPTFDAGVIDIDSVIDMREELIKTFGQNEGAAAYMELSLEAIRRVYLDRDAEKNSSSPAPSQPTPQATKETGSASEAGKSPASEDSPATPAA